MSISSEPEKKFDIQELLGSLNQSGENTVKLEKQKFAISTSETEDFAGSIELLNVIIETFAEMYGPYVEPTVKHMIPLLTFESNSDVRAEASNCLPELLAVVKAGNAGNTTVIHQSA